MRLGSRLVAAVGAVVVLGGLASVASAGRLSSSSQTWRATFSRWDISGGFGATECALTMEGSFHGRTIAKVARSLMGLVTRAQVGACPRGSATVLAETLPWHLRYQSFGSTLPIIAFVEMDITGMAWQKREPTFGITCLFIAREGQSMRMKVDFGLGGVLTQASLEATMMNSCESVESSGARSSSLTVLNNVNTRITVTLI